MKAFLSTAALFFIAGICFATPPQPTQQRLQSHIVDLLTYNNLIAQKLRPTTGPKIYAVPQDSPPPQTQLPVPATNQHPTSQTFTPTPMVNYYKEFR